MAGDHWRNIAWSDNVTFDLKHKSDSSRPDVVAIPKGNFGEKTPGPKTALWDMDVQALISSPKWLQLYGLKRNKLTVSQILTEIGILNSEDYACLERPLPAPAVGLFRQQSKDGRVYNLKARNETVLQKVEALTQALELYRQRMDWLTSGSRQVFGVIQEHSITIVLDFETMSKRQFDLCRNALCLVLREQVSRISRFNLIRAAEKLVKWQKKTSHVSVHAINCAVEWIWKLEQMEDAGKTGPYEAVLEAEGDNTVEAVYYFAVGDVPAVVKQLLLQTLSRSRCPIHTVSFNPKEKETLMFMKELSHQTSGRFHAFAETTEYKNVRFLTNGEENTEDLNSETIVKGGTPPAKNNEQCYLVSSSFAFKKSIRNKGAGVREDVFLIWQELEEAKNTLIEFQAIAVQSSLHSANKAPPNEKPLHQVHQVKSDDYVSSKEWLQKYSLKAQKLTFYDAIADCAFRHSDGVVDIKTKPENEELQTDAEKRKKLVNARYCDRFVHAHWKDGSVMHVYITSEKCKWYEERMKIFLEQMERRVKWLQHGSRELFGTVLEDQVCMLIDTSHSMKDKLALVKEKIFQLMQEQLRHKDKFNFVKFDSQVASWKNKLAEVNEENMESAWFWVKGLQVGSSTNTLKALQLALADNSTQAVYLLTDGRPDQPPETIMAQIQFQHPVPVHTISFNCDDTEANGFLYELSSKTGGRFHCYRSDLRDQEALESLVSEDIHLLMKEIEQGKNDLEKVQKLYIECLMLDWFHNGENGMKPKQIGNVPDMKSTARPQSAVESPSRSDRLHHHKLHNLSSTMSLQRKKALHAEHTRTSLLRSLCNGVKLHEDEAEKDLLLERNELFLRNNLKSAVAIKELLQVGDTPTEKKAKRIPKDSLDMSSSRWLRTHGLVARRLTIMDSLAPTAVPHTAKYVPILDKHIQSKVFDQVLPIAHISGDSKLITLINPLAVNLDAYKQKVERVIKSCERRLNLIIWKALSQAERDKFESPGPVAYKENTDALLEALDRLGWPIPYEDVTLLEDEMEAGATYIQQATELQQQAKEEALKGTDQKENLEGESITEEGTTLKPKQKDKRKVLDTLRGQRVIARSEVDGFYYPGIVEKCLGAKQALVCFSNGDAQITPVPFIIPIGGAVPCPALKVGDFVFCKSGTERGNCCYVPAIVIATPRRSEAAHKFYSVLKYNNRKEHTSRKDLVKISHAKFAFSCRSIQGAQLLEHTMRSMQAVQPMSKLVPLEDKAKGERRSRKKKSKKVEQKHQREPSLSDSESEPFSDGRSKDSDSIRHQKDFNLGPGKQDVIANTSQHSALPAPTDSILLEQHFPVPATPRSSTISPNPPTATSGQTFGPFLGKFEKMRDNLSQNQMKEMEQQQQIQASLKALHDDNGLAKEQKELIEKQMELLQRLISLTSAFQSEIKVNEEKVWNDDPPEAIETENNDSRLVTGRTVMCRSLQNGWYHRGSVVRIGSGHIYVLQDQTGELMRFSRENIISDANYSQMKAQEEDLVIGLHPLYPGSYCPGVVLAVFPNMELQIRYYDGVEGLVFRSEVYPVTPEMYKRDMAYIVQCEERWVGQPVVARDDTTETYHLADVQERVGNGKDYVIRWADGRTAVQKNSWIFGKYSPPHILKIGGHVLSLAYPSSLTFLPAVILDVNRDKLLVRFCNGESSQPVEPHLCFGLSEEQYNMAAQMYHKLLSEIKCEEEEEEVEEGVSEEGESGSETSSVPITPISSEGEDTEDQETVHLRTEL